MMMGVLPIAAAAALFWALSKRDADKRAKRVKKEVKRIARESREIVHGKRERYSNEHADAVIAARIAEAHAKRKRAKSSTSTRSTDRAIGPAPVKREAPPAPAPVKREAPPAPAPVKREAPPAPAPPAPPAGYDKVAASNAAPDVAKHLRNRGIGGYSRKLLKVWQVRAGIVPDGVYGRGTAAALRHFAGDAAPKPFFAQGDDFYPWAAV